MASRWQRDGARARPVPAALYRCGPPVRRTSRRGAWVAMADGSVRWIEESISPKIFEALSTMAGGDACREVGKSASAGVAAGQ